MENHSDREEFKEAMANGEGESTRFSKTLGYTTFYYAIKYNGGDFLQIRKTLQGCSLQ